MRWLFAGTGCACTLVVVSAWALGPVLAAGLALVTVVVAIGAAAEVILTHATHRAQLEYHARHELNRRTVTDTTSRPQ